MSLGIGVVGCGHWGPNLIRAFSSLPGVRVVAACDPDPACRARVATSFPGVTLGAGLEMLLDDPAVEAVAVASPAATHHEVALRCLDAGRHVLVEKPVGVSLPEVSSLCSRSREAGLLLMGGHVFLHHPAVLAVRDFLEEGLLGRLRHVRSVRVNPGPVRTDVDVVWDLLPHDLSMLWLWLGGAVPTRVQALAAHPLGTERADTVFAALEYPDGVLVSLAASWAEPAKVRRTVLVGDQGALEFNDLDLRRPLRFHRFPREQERYYQSFGEFQTALAEGPVEMPPVAGREPLIEECAEFVRRIRGGQAGPGPELEPITRCLSALGEAVRAAV